MVMNPQFDRRAPHESLPSLTNEIQSDLMDRNYTAASLQWVTCGFSWILRSYHFIPWAFGVINNHNSSSILCPTPHTLQLLARVIADNLYSLLMVLGHVGALSSSTYHPNIWCLLFYQQIWHDKLLYYVYQIFIPAMRDLSQSFYNLPYINHVHVI